MKWLGVILVLVVFEQITAKVLVCYYGTWATYRPGRGKFDVANIDPHLCTHLIYTFFGIQSDGGLRVIDPYLDLEENWGRGNIKQFNDLKKINPKLKTLAAVGGWNEGTANFSLVANSPAKRRRFAREAVQFVLRHGFDGLDMDWEYPGQREGNSKKDMKNFVRLLGDIKRELAPHGLLLTAAVGAAEFSARLSYDIPKVSQLLDQIHLMAYDFHGAWDTQLGLNAPLYIGMTDISTVARQMSVNAALKYWLASGVPKHKLILGMPLYGRVFTAASINDMNIGSAINGPGLEGPFTREAGMLGYNEICQDLGWKHFWMRYQMVPIAVKGDQWLSYDNKRSLGLKVDYANWRGLGGVMVWSIETDDFQNDCGQGKYPLLHAIKKALG